MSKIICDICSTVYEDTAPECPICGWVQEHSTAAEVPQEEIEFLDDVVSDESVEIPEEDEIIRPKKKRAIFDFDAVNTNGTDEVDEVVPEYEDEEEYEEEPRTNVFLVVFLVILIVALLLGSGFIFLKFYLPGKKAAAKETEMPTANAQIVEPETEETTIPTVPCTNLALPNGIDVLKTKGQYFLLHAVKMPEDTTDTLTYMSENESVAVVSEDGRVEAVGEGETNIIVTCGDQQISCPVTVRYEEETQSTEETQSLSEILAKEEAKVEGTAAEGAQNVEETQAASVPDDVVLKVKARDLDFQLGRQGVYHDIEMDCELTADMVEWYSSNSDIVMVENGRVTAMSRGIAKVFARYGDQEISCIVRCVF